MMRAVNISKYVKTIFSTNKLSSERFPHSKDNLRVSRVDEFIEKSVDSTFLTKPNLSESSKLSHNLMDIKQFNKSRLTHIFENRNIQCHETEKHIEEMKEIIKLQHQEHQEMKRRLEILEGGAKIYFH